MNDFWGNIASEISSTRTSKQGQHLVVGVDGVDGAGKTTFAQKLLEVLHLRIDSANTRLISIDDFHNVREIRHRQGKDSPTGFFEDSFDYESLKKRVLNPIRDSKGGFASIVPGSQDLKTDLLITPEKIRLQPSSVVIVEGIFLHRNEIREYFDFTIFLDVPFSESVLRLSNRDGSNPNPNHPSMNRYVEGQRIYFERCSPLSRASVIIDNSDPELPRVTSI